MTAVRIERENFVLHTAFGHNLPVGDAKFVNQRISVDVVESIPSREFGSFVLKNRGQVGVFSIEIQKISAETALLQHITATSQIVDPRTSLLCPCLIAVEPL